MDFCTLKYENGELVVLDQSRLPSELIYLRLSDYRDVIKAIKALCIRGAPAIGLAAAYASVLACNQVNSIDDLAKALDEIQAARPTASNPVWAINQIRTVIESNRKLALPRLQELILQKALQIHDEDRRMCLRIGENGARLIRDGMSILTHCNAGILATGGIGTALAVIYTAVRQGKRIKVFADETRPLFQGARLTTWELLQEQIDVTLNIDCAAASLMQAGKIDCVLTGADRVAKNLDAANKIGTYSLAVLAKYHKIPFYIAIPHSSYDPAMPSGKEIAIEMRPPEEIISFNGRKIAPDNISVYAPAFDVTPYQLITAIITDEEIIYPNAR